MSRPSPWPSSKRRSPSISSSIPARFGSSPSTSAADSARRPRLATRPSSPIKLARAAKAPVRVAFDRHEELSVAGYRPAAEVKIAILPGRDGALKALSLTAYSDAGVAVNSTVAGLARLIYPAEAKELIDNDVVSNLPPGCAVPRARAVRRWRSRSSRRSTRRRCGSRSIPFSCASAGTPIPTGSVSTTGPAALETWRRRPARRAADRPLPPRRRRRRWAIGSISGSSERRSSSAIEGGRLVASIATQDIGTGTRSVIADTVAREFGLEPHEVEVRIGDSKLPEGPTSGGSRVTASIVPPLLARRRQAQGRHRREDRTKAGAGIERAVARTHRRLARSQGRGGAREDNGGPSTATIRW